VNLEVNKDNKQLVVNCSSRKTTDNNKTETIKKTYPVSITLGEEIVAPEKQI
jgi:hypothetical protein